MKVLMLGWELPPNNSGGLGVACLQLSKALNAAGADIDFILPYYHEPSYDFMRVISAYGPGFARRLETKAYESYRYFLEDGSFLDLDMGDQQSAYTELVGRLAEQLEFDIIHAHDWLTFRAALLARQKKNVPLILHVHSIERDRAAGQPGNPWVREVEATAMLLADHVIAVSERTKQMICKDYGIPQDKVEVVHNSLDITDVQPVDGRNSFRYLEALKADGWKVVASVGRLTIQKGLPHLISAAGEVVKHLPKTIFLFVGDGEQRDELLQQAASAGIGPNVIFAGFQRGKHWRDAYSIADLFVMPSVSEPFGLTPYEAAAYSTPSLVSKQSGVSETFQNCLKVDFWDINEMANKMVAVLRETPLQAELSRNAGYEFQRLGWSEAAGRIVRRYNQFAERVPA